MKISKNTIDFVWDIAQKRDITIAGINGIANLSNSDDKILIKLYLNNEKSEITFYFLDTREIKVIKNPNRLIGFMYEKDATKEFTNHTTKKGKDAKAQNIIWLSKYDFCLALIDMMNFIKG